MNVHEEKTISYTLTMSEGDAKKLKAIVQNPLADGEPVDWSLFRERLFNALHAAGVKS